MVAGADRVRQDIGEHRPDAAASGRWVRGYAKPHGIPVIDFSGGQHKHDLAEEYLAKTTVTELVSDSGWSSSGTGVGCQRKAPYRTKKADALRQPLFVPHSRPRLGASDHQDQRASAVPAQVMLNGHKYIACQARKAGLSFTKEGNCLPGGCPVSVNG